MSPKAIAILASHLEDNKNSTDESVVVVASLLAVASGPLTDRVLSVVEKQANSRVTIAALQQLGLVRTRSPRALRFIEVSLERADVRSVAIDAIERLPDDLQPQYYPRLARIRNDSGESQENRSRAEAILQKRR